MEQLRIVRRSEDISGNRDRKKHTRIKNRRQMYLQRNPSYFSSSDLELAGDLGHFLLFMHTGTDMKGRSPTV
jgi:hypothetical protein